MTKLEQLKKKHATLKQEITEESKAFFQEESKVIFQKFPAVESFAWSQYTPYFNDGDECTFGVHSDADINGINEYDDEEKVAALPEGALEAVRELIDSIDASTMKKMFGDHVKITVTSKGVEIEEYQHD